MARYLQKHAIISKWHSAVRLPILSISITVLSKPVFIGGVYAIPLSPSVSVDGDDVLKKQNQRSHTADQLTPKPLTAVLESVDTQSRSPKYAS